MLPLVTIIRSARQNGVDVNDRLQPITAHTKRSGHRFSAIEPRIASLTTATLSTITSARWQHEHQLRPSTYPQHTRCSHDTHPRAQRSRPPLHVPPPGFPWPPLHLHGHRTKEGVWWIEGPGQDLPEPVRTPWCGSEECHEVWRLAQDEGDSAQGSRLGMSGDTLI
jgi:hypothetical protein